MSEPRADAAADPAEAAHRTVGTQFLDTRAADTRAVDTQTFDTHRLGARVRQLRQHAGLSLTSVARRLGVSPSALSQIETGVMQPSVSRLVEIMAVLDLPLTMVFDERLSLAAPPPYRLPEAEEPLSSVTVSRATRSSTTVDLQGGVVYRRLSPRALPGTEYFESIYPPGAASGDEGHLLVHTGTETGVVTSGRLTFQFADGEVELGAGDTIHFPATTGHRIVNRGPAVAVATWLTVGTCDTGVPA